MTGDRHHTEPTREDIFNDALALPPGERAAYLDRACGGNAALRAEIEAMLVAVARNPEFFGEEPQVPARIGRYPVSALLGAGGMGAVYRAHDTGALDREIAIKVLHSGGGAGQAALQREARTLARPQHGNIAAIHTFETDGDLSFLTMEYVDGKTLQALLREGALDARAKVRVCLGIACGMEAVHEAGIVHRDLKPGNVMVTATGDARVLDFGIARMRDAIETESAPGSDGAGPMATAMRTLVRGTPRYMSPEQRAGEPVDARSDIWAFGRVLVDCFETCDGYERDGIVFLDDPGLPRHARATLERLAARCLELDPSMRPATMSGIRRELQELEARMMAEASPRGRRRRRIMLAAASAAACAGVAFFAVRIISSWRSFPVSVTPAARGVAARMSNGTTRQYLLPDTIAASPDSAFIVVLGPRERDRLVVATFPGSHMGHSALLIWNRPGRVVALVPTTDDQPFQVVPPGETEALYAQKYISRIAPPGPGKPTLDFIELANMYPCVSRGFTLTPDAVSERYRIYHSGHLNSHLRRTAGIDSSGTWTWMTGVIRSGGVLRQAVRGAEGATMFIMCLPGEPEGEMIFPAWDPLNHAFAAARGGEVRMAEPLFYFVVRSFTERDGQLLWNYPQPIVIVEAWSARRGSLSLLFSNAMRLDVTSCGPDSLHLDASVTGTASNVLEERAREAGTSAARLMHRFLADSVLVLAATRPGLGFSGDFRDFRDSLVIPPENLPLLAPRRARGAAPR